MDVIYIKDGISVSGGFTSCNIFRLRAVRDNSPSESLLYSTGMIDNSLSHPAYPIDKNGSVWHSSTEECLAECTFSEGCIRIRTRDNTVCLEIRIESHQILSIGKEKDESFHGFGFHRTTFDANGKQVIFKKKYRWDGATVPFFISSGGYGVFSANTFEHNFDFTADDSYCISTAGGDTDIYVIIGPDFKEILNDYTMLTGRPVMVPRWAFGLCYAARLFENQEGLLEIAASFRKHGIPCDMIGLEPGWEKHYYQMEWEWNDELFPDPAKMIDTLHDTGFAFELWDSGAAPTKGFMNPDCRRKWFSKRVGNSIGFGVDFFKQDDPYPRCITTEEMVTEPDESVSVEDDGDYKGAEITSLANTLYSETLFDEFRRLTGKRTLVIFHSYASSFSSQRYPVVWAGDFKLGNGAMNAALSGHSMVTQDIRSEVPDGIHFGFLLPFTFMDSWAYYLEPWLFSAHIRDMVKFYSRLRSSLFPYLYSTFRKSHETGLPMLRPMLLEFQDDKSAHAIHDQYMLGDALMVCLATDRGSRIYLPAGSWVNYWTGEETVSKGNYYGADWPVNAGGALYVRKGSIIPRMPALDSLLEYKNDILIPEVYPGEKSHFIVYEDDGISYDYENGSYAKTRIESDRENDTVHVKISRTSGTYAGKPEYNKYLIKVFAKQAPAAVTSAGMSLKACDSNDMLLALDKPGYFYDKSGSFIYIKPQSGWYIPDKIRDHDSFYGICTKGVPEQSQPFSISIDLGSAVEQQNPTSCKKPICLDQTCHFSATANPPLRVRLNHGDNWLPYHVFIAFEIKDSAGNTVPVNTEVVLDAVTSKGRKIIQKTRTFEGTGHFDRIDLAEPGRVVSASIRLSAENIEPLVIKYSPHQAI